MSIDDDSKMILSIGMAFAIVILSFGLSLRVSGCDPSGTKDNGGPTIEVVE